jgi:hypothetical protein
MSRVTNLVTPEPSFQNRKPPCRSQNERTRFRYVKYISETKIL